MKVAVMGAGAVGCYYGGMLARAGHDVVLTRISHTILARLIYCGIDFLSFSTVVQSRGAGRRD